MNKMKVNDFYDFYDGMGYDEDFVYEYGDIADIAALMSLSNCHRKYRQFNMRITQYRIEFENAIGKLEKLTSYEDFVTIFKTVIY